jgi:hypothetical protein
MGAIVGVEAGKANGRLPAQQLLFQNAKGAACGAGVNAMQEQRLRAEEHPIGPADAGRVKA